MVGQALQFFVTLGLLRQEGTTYRYQPAAPSLDEIVGRVEAAYSEQPTTVISAIMEQTDDKLRDFANAFVIKKKD
jgi:hypothetical protein